MATFIRHVLAGMDRRRYRLRLVACHSGPFVSQLQQDGWTCDMLGVGPPPFLRRHTGTATRRLWRGYWRSLGWAVYATLKLAQYVRRHHVKLIHTHYHHYHGISGLAHALCGVKCVWHWHGQEWRRSLLVAGRFVQRLTRSFAWFVAISQATRATIGPLAGERVTVVYNGIPAPAPCCRRHELRQMLGVHDTTHLVGMVGSLNPIKGHFDFLQAASLVCRRRDDVHFVYIGGHNAAALQEYYARVLQRRHELGLEHRVHFLGHRDDAAELISGFDIKILTTLPPGEGFGLVIIEAMARRVPVIATDVGAPREILTHNHTGILVPPADPTALAQAIEDLLADPERRHRLGQAGYAAFCERFDIRRTVREIEAVYDRLLNRPTAAADA
jgi:glycosyltransferase involved in cell wall biosynthesis